MCELREKVMFKIQRVASNNPVSISNGHYNTAIKRTLCCGEDPDLYGGSRASGFFKEGVWQFKCSCGKAGDHGITPNAAAAYWNKSNT